MKKASICEEPRIYNEETKKCECPESAPYDTLSACITCNEPHYWDADRHVCEVCATGLYYSSFAKKCISCPEGFSYDKKIQRCISVCEGNQIYNSETEKCECPIGSHYDGTKCITCPDEAFWSE